MNSYQRAREMAGLTQKELASIIGVKPAVISRYESEDENIHITPPVSRLKSIAQACNVDVAFLTDQLNLTPLNDIQKNRFRDEISAYNNGLKHWPRETKRSYGTEHPFLYMLKERWEPAIEDVEYIERKFGIKGKYILNEYVVNQSVADAQLKERLDPTVYEIIDYLDKAGFKIGIEEAKMLAQEGIIALSNNEGKGLFLNVNDLDPDMLKALVVMVKSSRKGLRTTPVRIEIDKVDVWEKASESDDGQSSGWWARGMDLTLEEAEKLVDAYDSEKENPPQDQKDPETERVED